MHYWRREDRPIGPKTHQGLQELLVDRDAGAVTVVFHSDEQDANLLTTWQVVGKGADCLAEFASIGATLGSLDMVGFAVTQKPVKFVVGKHDGS
jgi:hypothetical protein